MNMLLVPSEARREPAQQILKLSPCPCRTDEERLRPCQVRRTDPLGPRCVIRELKDERGRFGLR